jgi:hypothetical protein
MRAARTIVRTMILKPSSCRLIILGPRGALKPNATSAGSLADDFLIGELLVTGSSIVASLIAGSLVVELLVAGSPIIEPLVAGSLAAGLTAVGDKSSWPGAIGFGLSSPIRGRLVSEILSTVSVVCAGVASGCSWLNDHMESLDSNVAIAPATGSDAACEVMPVVGRSLGYWAALCMPPSAGTVPMSWATATLGSMQKRAPTERASTATCFPTLCFSLAIKAHSPHQDECNDSSK